MYSWITKRKRGLGDCISVTFRNQITIKLQIMYALKEKYRALEVEYQTTIYPISTQLLQGKSWSTYKKYSDILIFLCVPSHMRVYPALTLPPFVLFFWLSKNQVPAFFSPATMSLMITPVYLKANIFSVENCLSLLSIQNLNIREQKNRRTTS